MKIECDKCAAKYSIADEKVRGKTFKIRCKKCSNVIIVRDKGAAPTAAAAAVDQAPGWHLAINGETVGPMAEDEVRQRYEAGEIDKETAIWQEGFEDWVPLGDVDAFAGLPERPAAAAEDPFTSANQDDYAAPAAVAAVGGAAPMEQARSPRVSQLTGQRNENSVLFSLDSLQSLATGGGAAAAASPGAPVAAPRAAVNPARGLATSAPSSEGSGLIDIRALGAMVGGAGAPSAAAAPQGAADDAALPSFGGGGLGGLTSAPLIAPAAFDSAALAAAPMAQQPRSQAPLYIMMAFLLLTVLGLVAFVLLREPETKIVKETVTAPAAVPSVKGADVDDDKKDKDDEENDDDSDKDEDGAGAADGDAEDTDGDDAAQDADGGAAGMADSSSSGSKKRNNNNNKKKKSGGGGDGGKQAASEDPLSAAMGGGGSKSKDSGKSGGGGSKDPGIDCILDPSKCGGGTKKKKDEPKAAAVDPSLPKVLTQADIKKGVAPHKNAGKACGAKHGGAPGEKVLIKLSISGATGKVSKAAATGKHANTPLGNCVAQALKNAQFIKFQKSSLGVQYPIRL